VAIRLEPDWASADVEVVGAMRLQPDFGGIGDRGNPPVDAAPSVGTVRQAASFGFGATFVVVAVVLIELHLPPGSLVGAGPWGFAFWPTLVMYTFAYGVLAGPLGALAAIVWALLRRRSPHAGV
jgi:hypothetical protein